MDKKLKKNKVVQSNFLIEASYRLNLDEKRLLVAGISQINPKETIPSKVQVTVKDYAELYGLDINAAYGQVKQAKDSLYERDIRIKNKEIDDRIRWVDRVTYHKKEGRVSLHFSAHIKEYISELSSRFTQYTLENTSGLKSIYSIRIYELISQYMDFGERWIYVDEFREMFDLSDKYAKYSDLRINVIEPAVTEINSKTNLILKFKPEKDGRKIIKLWFYFEEKKQTAFNFVDAA